MTPECPVCGFPALRPAGHASWCARIAAWLATNPPPPVLAGCTGTTTSYNGGCRCGDCRVAINAAKRRYMARKRAS